MARFRAAMTGLRPIVEGTCKHGLPLLAFNQSFHNRTRANTRRGNYTIPRWG